MVSIRKAKQGFQLRSRHQTQSDKEKLGLFVAGLCVAVLIIIFTSTTGSNDINTVAQSEANHPLRYRKPHPELVLEEEEEGNTHQQPNAKIPHKREVHSDVIDAMALDVLETLNCEELIQNALKQFKAGGDERMEDVMPETDDQPNHRRLEENRQHGDDGGFQHIPGNADPQQQDTTKDDDVNQEEEEDVKWGREAMGNADMMNGMDDAPGFGYQGDDGLGYASVSAKHLFCLAAMPKPPQELISRFSCAAGGAKRRSLLDLWTSARAQILDTELLKNVLSLAREQQSVQILDENYNLWAPSGDTGITYMTNTLNNELKETLKSLEPSLGAGKLFVDVGSGMGLTTLAISQQYPETKIVSIEPASPNWLLQQLNLRCNLAKPELSKIKVILAGVGPNTDDEDNIMAKLMWRPTSTTSTRAWTPAEEFGSQDLELLVRLRKLRSILAEADVYLTGNGSTPNMMDVLNLDCQGCEYNLIPALSEEEFDAIPNVMGNIHWGYIPLSKLPSSERGRQTHGRLCQHETIAKTTKECCAFLNTPVKSSVPGEVLYRDNGQDNRREVVTVLDIIQEGLCDDFEKWSVDHYMNVIKDDWGWFELSSQAH